MAPALSKPLTLLVLSASGALALQPSNKPGKSKPTMLPGLNSGLSRALAGLYLLPTLADADPADMPGTTGVVHTSSYSSSSGYDSRHPEKNYFMAKQQTADGEIDPKTGRMLPKKVVQKVYTPQTGMMEKVTEYGQDGQGGWMKYALDDPSKYALDADKMLEDENHGAVKIEELVDRTPSEDALRKELKKAKATIAALEPLEQKVALDFALLPQYKVELAALIGGLPQADKEAIFALLKQQQFSKALESLIADEKDLPEAAKLLPKMNDLMTTLKAIDADSAAVVAQAELVANEMQAVEAALKEYIKDDKSPGSLGDLLAQLEAQSATLKQDAGEVTAAGIQLEQWGIKFVNNTISNREFDKESFDHLMQLWAQDQELIKKIQPDVELAIEESEKIMAKLEEILGPDAASVLTV